jgi:hypothetical protein
VIDTSDRRVTIEVTNRTSGARIPDRSSWKPAQPLGLRGRGLDVVDQVADEIEIRTDPAQVLVKATIWLGT